MRAVVQRVRTARVEVHGDTVGSIGQGLLVYLGVGAGDTAPDAVQMAQKLATLRIFEDEQGKMNRSVEDVGQSVLVVSQFTLFGDARKGRRPSFAAAAPPERAEPLYQAVCAALRSLGLHVQQGRFRAEMAVHAEVDGPVTILVDSERVF
jgi:D-tyrosyl-tRNA(Tyr) deacylase